MNNYETDKKVVLRLIEIYISIFNELHESEYVNDNLKIKLSSIREVIEEMLLQYQQEVNIDVLLDTEFFTQLNSEEIFESIINF